MKASAAISVTLFHPVPSPRSPIPLFLCPPEWTIRTSSGAHSNRVPSDGAVAPNPREDDAVWSRGPAIRVPARGRRAGHGGQARRAAGDGGTWLERRRLRPGARRQPARAPAVDGAPPQSRHVWRARIRLQRAGPWPLSRWPSSIATCARPIAHWWPVCRSPGRDDRSATARGAARQNPVRPRPAKRAPARLRPRTACSASGGTMARRFRSSSCRRARAPPQIRVHFRAIGTPSWPTPLRARPLAARRSARDRSGAARQPPRCPASNRAAPRRRRGPLARATVRPHRMARRALDRGAGVVRLAAVALPDRALDRLVRACDLRSRWRRPMKFADGELVRLESRRGSPIGLAIVDRAAECWRLMTRAHEPWTSLGEAWVDARLDAAAWPGAPRPAWSDPTPPSGWRTALATRSPGSTRILRRFRDRVGADSGAGAGGRRAGATAGGPRPGRRRGGEAPRPRRRGAQAEVVVEIAGTAPPDRLVVREGPWASRSTWRAA